MPNNIRSLRSRVQGLVLAALLSPALALPALAETPAQRETATRLALQISQDFVGKTLATQDQEPPYLEQVALVIKHSLSENEFERKSFQSLRALEAWLQSRRVEAPGRNSAQSTTCKQGLCRFEITGLLHNNLYFEAASYVYLNGKPYLKTIYLLDGD